MIKNTVHIKTKIKISPDKYHVSQKRGTFLLPIWFPIYKKMSFIQFCSDFQSETSYDRTKDVVMHINYNNEVTSLKINKCRQAKSNVIVRATKSSPFLWDTWYHYSEVFLIHSFTVERYYSIFDILLYCTIRVKYFWYIH